MIQYAEVRTDKYKPVAPDVQDKIERSFTESLSLTQRELHCPYCRRYIATLFTDSGGHLKMKCNNCKSITTFNVGYFRRHRYTRWLQARR